MGQPRGFRGGTVVEVCVCGWRADGLCREAGWEDMGFPEGGGRVCARCFLSGTGKLNLLANEREIFSCFVKISGTSCLFIQMYFISLYFCIYPCSLQTSWAC